MVERPLGGTALRRYGVAAVRPSGGTAYNGGKAERWYSLAVVGPIAVVRPTAVVRPIAVVRRSGGPV